MPEEAAKELAWQEPAEFQELLRRRRLRLRSFWQNARPLAVNIALLFSVAMLALALVHREEVSRILAPLPLCASLAFALGASLIWRSVERRRRVQVLLEEGEDGALYLTRCGDFRRQRLDRESIRVYVIQTLREGPCTCRVLILKTADEQQRLVCFPDSRTAELLEERLQKLEIRRGVLDQSAVRQPAR